jgi:hypothetical protein
VASSGGPDTGVVSPVIGCLRVRSARGNRQWGANGSSWLAPYLVFWSALDSLSWHFDILDILVSLGKHLPLISIIDPSS